MRPKQEKRTDFGLVFDGIYAGGAAPLPLPADIIEGFRQQADALTGLGITRITHRNNGVPGQEGFSYVLEVPIGAGQENAIEEIFCAVAVVLSGRGYETDILDIYACEGRRKGLLAAPPAPAG